MTIQEFKDRLQIPVISSPMFLVSRTKLVIEACKNGVCGTFPSLNGRTSEEFEEMLIEITTELQKFEAQTGIKPAPFGVNIIVNHTNPRIQSDLTLCAKYNVPLIITSLGAVKEIVDAVHGYGGLVFHDVIKKRHAEKAAEAGVDGIIAVASGAGGHAGLANPFSLIADIKSVFNGLILLAGGLNSGNDIAAALAMGADFAYMGTRFIATQEAAADEEYKKMIIDSTLEDIIYTSKVSGVHANFLIKSLERANVNLNTKVEEDFSKLNGDGQKAWKDIWSAGHGVSGIHDIPSTKELIDKLKTEYKAVLLNSKKELENLKF